jgi:hypothetical protein
MTICIAAICESGHTLVLAADREVGIQITSAELLDGKFHHLFGQWSIGISGTVANATDVIAAARRLRSSLPSLASWDVRCGIEKAYREVRLAKAEAEYLANRGWSLKDFKDIGSTKLPASTYANIDARISLFDFNTDLIVAGFGEGDDGPCILTVTNSGVCTEHSKLGFWCVGSGATAAQMTLFARNFSWSDPAERAAYYVLEAKINAEQAAGVGEKTDLYLVSKGKNTPIIIPLQQPTMEIMKNIWEDLKPKTFGAAQYKSLEGATEFKLLRTT